MFLYLFLTVIGHGADMQRPGTETRQAHHPAYGGGSHEDAARYVISLINEERESRGV